MGMNIKVNETVIKNLVGNNMSYDFPEDATWGRELSDIFWAGVKAGRMTKTDKEIKIEPDEFEE